MKCIFCNSQFTNKRSEHILPESLGGEDWACLPDGVMCDACNQYFGSKVENKALNSFPLLPFRLFLNIPSKKKKPPKMDTYLGEIKSIGLEGKFGLDPSNKEIESFVNKGDLSTLYIPTDVSEPLALCRLLLKMGLQTVACDTLNDAFLQKFNDARVFARSPRRSSNWWFLLYIDHQSLFHKFIGGVSHREWYSNIKLEVVTEFEAEIFHLKLMDMHFITPLESRVIPYNLDTLPQPDYQLIWATNG